MIQAIKDVIREKAGELICRGIGHKWEKGEDRIIGLKYDWCKRCGKMVNVERVRFPGTDDK